MALPLLSASNAVTLGLVSGLPDAVTLTRASSGTYFDVAGTLQTAATNAPRFAYDPTTLAPLGLRIEGQATNLLLNSLSLGTQSVTVTAQAYTLSFYGTGTVTLSGAATATVTGTGATALKTSTFTPSAGTLTLTVTGAVNYGQLETGPIATSWVPTTGTTATRAADVVSLTAAAFRALVNTAGGAVIVDAMLPQMDSTSGVFAQFIQIDDGTNNNRNLLSRWNGSANPRVAGVTSGAFSTSNNIGTITAGTTFRVGMRWSGASLTGSFNGGALVTPVTASSGSLTTFRVGSSATSDYLNGYVSRVSILRFAPGDAAFKAFCTQGAAI